MQTGRAETPSPEGSGNYCPGRTITGWIILLLGRKQNRRQNGKVWPEQEIPGSRGGPGAELMAASSASPTPPDVLPSFSTAPCGSGPKGLSPAAQSRLSFSSRGAVLAPTVCTQHGPSAGGLGFGHSYEVGKELVASLGCFMAWPSARRMDGHPVSPPPPSNLAHAWKRRCWLYNTRRLHDKWGIAGAFRCRPKNPELE